MRIKLLGKYWNLIFKTMPEGEGGLCEHPNKKNKTITIHNKLPEDRKLAILIHEMLHATSWHADEEWVDVASRDIANVLIRLGYRCTPNLEQ